MITNQQSYREKISYMISWGHWFTLFNIFFALLLSSRYLLVTDWPASLLGRIYAWSSWLGHFSFVVFIAYLLIIFPLTFVILSPRLLRLIYIVVATIGLTLILLDSMIFSYLHLHLHLNSVIWQLITNPDQGEFSRRFQQIFIAVPIIFLLELLLATWSWQKLRSLQHRYFARPIIGLFIAAFFTSHLIYIWADANFYRPVTMQRANFPLSYPMTARRFLEKYGWLDGKAYQRRLIEQGNPDALPVTYPLDEITYRDKGAGYNLLLVTLNSLSYEDMVKSLPSLKQFASENVQFSNYYSIGKTAQSGLFGLFYGISANYLDSILNTRTPSVLLNALRHQGYRFSLFSSDGFNSPLFNYALLADYTLPSTHAQSNNVTLNQWHQWIEKQQVSSSPWFSWISLSGIKLENASQVTNTDKQIAVLLEVLQQKKRLADTVVVITAHAGNDNIQNKNRDREAIHLPLIIHWPGIPSQTITSLSNQHDLMTTLMQHLLHTTTNPIHYSQGEDLFSSKRQRYWSSSNWDNKLMILTPESTYLLNGNDDYQAWNSQGILLKNDKPQLALLLQVLRAEKRFIAN